MSRETTQRLSAVASDETVSYNALREAEQLSVHGIVHQPVEDFDAQH